MPENEETIDQLEARLDALVRTQIDFQKEILQIRSELASMRGAAPAQPPQPQPPRPERPTFLEPGAPPPKALTELPPKWSAAPPAEGQQPPQQPPPPLKQGPPRPGPATAGAPTNRPPVNRQESQAPNFGRYSQDSARAETKPAAPKQKSDIEKFVGENLLSKIGIVILIIGVAIGAKYAIDRGWITPFMRVAFGYGVGAVLVGLAFKLRAKYLNFSAVLLGGGMAIMYFITYFAYGLYELIPQSVAFVLMVMFTVFTVSLAIVYNRQAIAHFGLVGAYAVPFLLSNDSGNFVFLFSYIAVINVGILTISIKKYWKPLIYTSFIFTWATFFGWYLTKYDAGVHLYPGLIFLGLFFTIFYLTTIIQHRLFAERTALDDLAITLLNAAVFYAFSLSMMAVRGDSFATLFAYIAAFTVGIIVISVRDYRRPLLYASFFGSWLIYFIWYVTKYRAEEHFQLAIAFLGIFFAIFYIAGLVHSNMFKEKAIVENTAPILTNSFIFFGFGYAILHRRPEFAGYMGLYAVAHAGLHFAVSNVTSRVRSFPVEITYLLTALVITFITIAIPIQFDGHVITLVWAVEAAILFWFGRVRQIRLFEYFAYPLMILSTVSLAVDWFKAAQHRTPFVVASFEQPFFNGIFLTALVYVAAFAFIYYINGDEKYESAIPENNRREVGILLGALGLGVLYNAFRIEINNYFHYLSVKTQIPRLPMFSGETEFRTDNDLNRFNYLWQINYTMLFLSLVSLLNITKVRSKLLGYTNLIFSSSLIAIFSMIGLFLLMELRESYLLQREAEFFARTLFHIAIRYISYGFVAALFFLTYRYTKQGFMRESVSARFMELGFDLIFYLPLWIITSSELINLMDIYGYNDSYKLGLSILWGVYALFLVSIGIYFNKKHLRVGAIVLFAFTLVKLFLYDIASLSTIAKTAVFVSLGVLMLIVSFLYNKYKALIVGYGDDPAGN